MSINRQIYINMKNYIKKIKTLLKQNDNEFIFKNKLNIQVKTSLGWENCLIDMICFFEEYDYIEVLAGRCSSIKNVAPCDIVKIYNEMNNYFLNK